MRRKSIILSDGGEAVEKAIASYCSDPRLQDIRKSMNERNWNVNDTDITYRMIGHWDKQNLLPESLRESSGWRKFSFVEMIWLRIIKHLREFGLSLEKIVFVKDDIMTWNKKTNTYDNFEYYIFESWKSASDPYLMVASNGDAEIGNLPDMKAVANMIGQHDIILISLTTIIEEVGRKAEEKHDLFTLTDEHKALLAEINSGTKKEIKIRVNDGKILEIESVSNMTAVLAAEVRKQMKDKKLYGELSIQFEEGVPKSIQVKKRKRFKK